MPRLTPAELDALEAAHKAATEGEWVFDDDDVYTNAGIVGNIVCQPPDGDCEQSLELWPRNRRFIVAAHNALPALIAEIRELRGGLENLIDTVLDTPYQPAQETTKEVSTVYVLAMRAAALEARKLLLPSPKPPIDNKQQTKDTKTE